MQVIPTRLALLRAGASAPATVGVHREGALGKAASSGSMVLAWHTNIASGGLDPQLHEVTSAEDVIIFAVGFPAT